MSDTITRDELVELIVAGLKDDGDTVDLPDGRRAKLIIEHDPDTSINDFECYGKVSEYCYRYWDDEGRTPRPEGFTGAARKIQVDRGYWMWWEPYRDDHKVYDSPEEVRNITDLLRSGFSQVGVRLLEQTFDSRGQGHWVEVDTNWLSGIDSLDNDYLPEVVSGLAWEVLNDDRG